MAWNQDFGEGARPGIEREQQSWRDSFNGGRAAGDWTGNHNARIASEREAFQGTTWSGSSTQPSALELARSFVGPGVAAVTTGVGAAGTGPGNAGVVTQPRKGGGGNLTFAVGGTAPLSAKIKGSATGGYAGVQVLPNPWFSDVQEWWEPRYGEPGEWLGGIVNVGVDGLYNAGRFTDWATGANTVSGHKRGTVKLETQLESAGAWGAIAASFDRQFDSWDRQLHEVFAGGRPYVGGGF